MTDDIFTRHRVFSPALLDTDFAIGLRHLARHRILRGGVPSRGSRTDTGFYVGEWLWTHQVNPHVLAERERAWLLAVPGVRLTPLPLPPTPGMSIPHPDRERLWSRISDWAVPEQMEAAAV